MRLPKTLLGFIWHFMKKQKGYFIVLQVLALAWTIDNTAWPYIYKVFIGKILTFTDDKAEIWHYLMPVLIVWFGVWILIDVMFRLAGFLSASIFPKFEAAIRLAMFEYMQGHSYDYFASHFAGNISNRISDMTQSATRVVQALMRLYIPAFFALVVACVIFFSVSPWFALLLAGWSTLHIGTCLAAAPKCSKLSSLHSDARSHLTGKVIDSFSNIINVKLFARKDYEYAYVNRYQQDEKKKSTAALVFIEKVRLILSVSAFIFPGLLLTWYMIYSWQQGLIGVADLVLLTNLTWNIQMLTWIAGTELPDLFKEIGTCQQALSIIRAEHDVTDAKDAIKLKVSRGEIKYDNVKFQYLGGSRVFENMSVTIEAGSKVGLVGFSGSGKSSFVNLIMRFFDVESGHILIDDHDISQATSESLRSQISMIPQDPTLFHRTLMENIRYGKIDASSEEVLTASKHAHCDEFISQLPEGYESLVGERGIKLSGGQRQRIAIARAILEDAPILILDEATSALDSVTEKRVQDALHYLIQNRTTIVIAHRLSTLAEMDRILVFDNGKVVEEGTHQGLLKANGHYAKMWHMQAGGFLPDNFEKDTE